MPLIKIQWVIMEKMLKIVKNLLLQKRNKKMESEMKHTSGEKSTSEKTLISALDGKVSKVELTDKIDIE